MKVARIIRKSLKFEPPEYLNPFLIIFPSGVYLRSLLAKVIILGSMEIC